MSRAALIDAGGSVVNIIEIATDADYTPPDGCVIVPDADGAAVIGGTWDGSTFVAPPVPPPTTDDLVAYAEQQKAALLAAGALHEATGLHLALDDPSRTDLGGVATTAVANLAGLLPWPDKYVLGWITIENIRIPMPTPADGLAVAALAGVRYAEIVQTARTIKDAIAAGTITTTAEIDAAFA